MIDCDAYIIYCLWESFVVNFMEANNSSISKKSRLPFIDEVFIYWGAAASST